ncbi:MAG: 5-oxoprolinase subunit PxpB [Enterocloster sp.]
MEVRAETCGLSLKPVGDRAVLAELGNRIDEEINRRVMALEALVREVCADPGSGIVETVPAFSSLLVTYDPVRTDFEEVAGRLRKLSRHLDGKRKAGDRIAEIPVCYGGSFGEDLPFVAKHASLTEKEVIEIHSGRDYRIYMLGFLPGFPYLGGMDERIFTPRLASPRTKIPAGSVGIGGEQTGIYPVESPGGWQLIGRTPLRLFDPRSAGSLPYAAGDVIRFVPISEKEYRAIEEKERLSSERERRPAEKER